MDATKEAPVSSARLLSPASGQRAEYQYLYYEPEGGVGGVVQADLSHLTERHRIRLKAPLLFPIDPLAWPARRPDVRGMVIVMRRGWLTRREMQLARRVLRS